jgi:hypothetical protein
MGYRIPFVSLRGIVDEIVEVNLLKVVERVVVRSDGPPLSATNFLGSDYEGKLWSKLAHLTLETRPMKGSGG